MQDWAQAWKRQDCRAILSLLEDAKAAGDRFAFYLDGLLSERGMCVEKSYARAVEQYRMAARLEVWDAYLALGQLYHGGWGVEMDSAKARQWFRRAVLHLIATKPGERESVLSGKLAPHSVPVPLLRALAWMETMEAQGPEMILEVGRRLTHGDGFARDWTAALLWIRRVDNKNYPPAMYEYAKWFLVGRMKERFRREGILRLYRAAKAGSVAAQIDLARRFAEGDRTRKNDRDACTWLHRAKKLGGQVEPLMSTVCGRLGKTALKTVSDNADKGRMPLP